MAAPITSAVIASAAASDAENLISEVKALLRARGERMTGPRRAVLAVLAQHGGHLGADDVVTMVAAHDPGVHRASVYRTLDALSHLGVIQHIHVGHGATTYHLVRPGHRHLHAQCRLCGSVRDLPPDILDEVAAALSRDHGFALDAGHVALSGICHQCERTHG
jgi:Fe2+ or Zn2+ uptake regulation protein